MVAKIRETAQSVVVRFGGGINSLAGMEDIADDECTDGQNFDLEVGRRLLISRKAFLPVFQAPNGQPIAGYINLQKTNGDTSLAIQAGGKVYKWDGVELSAGVDVGDVSAAAALRGPIRHNFSLDEVCIVTDLNGVEPVKQWDGESLTTPVFKKSDNTDFGTFKARYCALFYDRAVYGNVADGTGAYQHMVVGSKLNNFNVISVASRPSSSLSADDPWFLTTPDLRPVNGLLSAFGQLVIATKNTGGLSGSFYTLSGLSAKDFALTQLYGATGPAGSEGVAFIGNDIVYGVEGRIESLAATDTSAQVENDDLSLMIKPSVSGYNNWRLVYSAAEHKLYCFPDGVSECWVFYKTIAGSGVSPWSRWVTAHPIAMRPTCVFSAISPLDRREYVYMGDETGTLYQLEASTAYGDGKQYAISVSRTSKLGVLPDGKRITEMDASIDYVPTDVQDVTIQALLSGDEISTEAITLRLAGATQYATWGDQYFWGDQRGVASAEAFYWGSTDGRYRRQTFGIAGSSNQLAIAVSFDTFAQRRIASINVRVGQAY